MARRVLLAFFAVLIVAGVVLRIDYVVRHNPLDHIRSDPQRHWEQGVDALRDDPMTLLDPVAYQLFVGVLAKLTLGDRRLVAFYVSVLACVTPWIWYRFLRELQPSKLVAVGGWAALSVLPSWITIYGFFMQETLLLPLLGAALWATWRCRRKRDSRSFLLMVWLWILAGLTRGVAIPLAAVACAGVWWEQDDKTRKALRALLLLVLLLGPLTYRGYHALRIFAPHGSGNLASLYAHSGKERLRISYERGGQRWAYWFRSPATGDRPLAPLSDWHSARTGMAEVHVDLDHGERDWTRAAEEYPLTLGRYAWLVGENTIFLFFGSSWPDWTGRSLLARLGRELRWLWAPLTVAVIAWTAVAWHRLRDDRLLAYVLATWLFVQGLLPISVNEGRYRKPAEGLLFAQVALLIGTRAASGSRSRDEKTP